jgi:hypothetical protein
LKTQKSKRWSNQTLLTIFPSGPDCFVTRIWPSILPVEEFQYKLFNDETTYRMTCAKAQITSRYTNISSHRTQLRVNNPWTDEFIQMWRYSCPLDINKILLVANFFFKPLKILKIFLESRH